MRAALTKIAEYDYGLSAVGAEMAAIAKAALTERDALAARCEKLEKCLRDLAAVYGPLSSSMAIGSERRTLWDSAFAALAKEQP